MLQTKEEIENWLLKVNIKNYVINDNLVVDVDGSVNLYHRNLTEIPVQFGVVNGNFWCFANKLISLKGAPYEVTKAFHCAINQLTNLDFCPKIIGSSFNCLMNPLTSLKGFDSDIKKDFMHSYYINNPFEIIELKDYYLQCEDSNHDGPYMRVNISGNELIKLINYNELDNTILNSNNKLIKKIKV